MQHVFLYRKWVMLTREPERSSLCSCAPEGGLHKVEVHGG